LRLSAFEPGRQVRRSAVADAVKGVLGHFTGRGFVALPSFLGKAVKLAIPFHGELVMQDALAGLECRQVA
jgi:hypothetical protein